MQSNTERRIIREAERKRRTSISRMQWYRKELAGEVPRRVHLGNNSVGWFEDEIEKWMDELAARRAAASSSEAA